MRATRVKINLNPSKEDDRRVLDYLRYSGVSYTKAVTEAILFFLDAREKSGDSDRFLQEVKETIRESVQGLQLTPAGGGIAASVEVATDEEEVSPLDFLEAMMSGVTSE